MANIEMKFYDPVYDTYIKSFAKNSTEMSCIQITIDDEYTGSKSVFLDRATAIRFQKELKRQISLIEE